MDNSLRMERKNSHHIRPQVRMPSTQSWFCRGLSVLLFFGAVVIFSKNMLLDMDRVKWNEEKVPGYAPVSDAISLSSNKISLEAHIMSQCPDARDCLHDLIVPTMQSVVDEVDFRLSFIGQLIENGDGVECKHGAKECLGNIISLCASNLYPDPKISLGFTMCLIDKYDHIPEPSLVKDCALEHGVDFDQLNDCVSKDDGSFGMDLLRNSVARSSQANVTLSCTIRLNDQIRCIRDGGRWKDCGHGHKPSELIHDIHELSKI